MAEVPSHCPGSLWDMPWTDEDIQEALESVSMYHKEGYDGFNSSYPKDLPTLLYNSRSHKSAFVKAFQEPPETISEANTKSALPKEKDPDTTNFFSTILMDFQAHSCGDAEYAREQLSSQDMAELIRRSNELVDYNNKLLNTAIKEQDEWMFQWLQGAGHLYGCYVDEEPMSEEDRDKLDWWDTANWVRHEDDVSDATIQALCQLSPG